MKPLIILGLLGLLVFVNCNDKSSRDTDRELARKSKMLSTLIERLDTVNKPQYNNLSLGYASDSDKPKHSNLSLGYASDSIKLPYEGDLFLKYIPDTIDYQDGFYGAYVLDASCSFCIGKFIEFVYVKAGNIKPVYLFTSMEAKERVEYYLSDAKLDTSDIYVVGIDNPEYTLDIWIKNNSSVYLMKSGKVYNKFSYEKL